ncbi:MAG: YitT family protein [Clostridia bacterium]|nr:YitT family protein [Clostridia bacterium]
MEKNKLDRKKFMMKEDIITTLIIILVSFIQGAAINIFYVQHSFLSGGFTGIGLLLDYAIGLPAWVTLLVLNIPACIIGLKYLSKRFIIHSFVGTIVFTVALTMTEGLSVMSQSWFAVENELIAAFVGGAIVGISGACVVRRDASLGGMDIVSCIISRISSIQMGTINIMLNVVIMILLGIVKKDVELALCSLIAAFVCNVAFNYALEGFNRTVTVFIISEEWDEIAPDVLKRMRRGVTYIPAVGAYTGAERKIVYCIVKTSELATLKRIVKSHDPVALFSIVETKEVVGRGFGALN